MKILQCLLLGMVLLLAPACVRRNTRAIESPYQRALNAYYLGLQNGNLRSAERQLNLLLTKQADDPAARVLLTQLLLDSLRKNATPQPLLQRRIVQNLQLLAFDPPAKEDGATGWIAPRTYTLFADLLIVQVPQLLKTPNNTNIWRAYLLARGAEYYYRAAYDQAMDPKAAVSRGLLRERENALSGLLQAQFGIVEALRLLDQTNQFVPVRRLLEQASQVALRLSESNLRDLPTTLPAFLRLDGSYQRNFKVLESTLVVTTLVPQIITACDAGAPAQELEKMWLELVARTQKSAIHGELANVLLPNPENDETPIKLLERFLLQKSAYNCGLLTE